MEKDEILESLEKWLSNPENVKSFEEKILKEQAWETRWIEKFHNLDESCRRNIIYKTIKKYESKEYTDKEYFKHHREPECYLYYELFLPYAEKYGKELEVDEIFMTEKYEFDDYWIIELYQGQGSFIKIYPKEYQNNTIEFYSEINDR